MPSRPISPLAAKRGERVQVKAIARCNGRCVGSPNYGVTKPDPTCPVHGQGRPAGTGK